MSSSCEFEGTTTRLFPENLVDAPSRRMVPVTISICVGSGHQNAKQLPRNALAQSAGPVCSPGVTQSDLGETLVGLPGGRHYPLPKTININRCSNQFTSFCVVGPPDFLAATSVRRLVCDWFTPRFPPALYGFARNQRLQAHFSPSPTGIPP